MNCYYYYYYGMLKLIGIFLGFIVAFPVVVPQRKFLNVFDQILLKAFYCHPKWILLFLFQKLVILKKNILTLNVVMPL